MSPCDPKVSFSAFQTTPKPPSSPTRPPPRPLPPPPPPPPPAPSTNFSGSGSSSSRSRSNSCYCSRRRCCGCSGCCSSVRRSIGRNDKRRPLNNYTSPYTVPDHKSWILRDMVISYLVPCSNLWTLQSMNAAHRLKARFVPASLLKF